MFIKRAITRYQLSRIAHRIINVLNNEAIFQPSQIQVWRSNTGNDVVQVLGDIGKAIAGLRIESLLDFDLKTAHQREREREKEKTKNDDNSKTQEKINGF